MQLPPAMSPTAIVDQEQPDYAEPPQELKGAAALWNHRVDEGYCPQPGKLFRLMSQAQQQVLKIRHIGNCYKADPACREGLARALGDTDERGAEIEKHS